MNANELADLLEVDSWYKLVTREEIATMLRQQQAEIGFYKQDADKYKQKCASQQAEIEALNRFIEERGETGQFIIWKTKQ
jgi:DNA phosphorothioation-dependent restriction protein DptG